MHHCIDLQRRRYTRRYLPLCKVDLIPSDNRRDHGCNHIAHNKSNRRCNDVANYVCNKGSTGGHDRRRTADLNADTRTGGRAALRTPRGGYPAQKKRVITLLLGKGVFGGCDVYGFVTIVQKTRVACLRPALFPRTRGKRLQRISEKKWQNSFV